MYKTVIILFITCCLSHISFAQKKVKCKSGQLLELTSKGELISTNSNALLEKYEAKDALWQETYATLLANEMNNRLQYAEKEVEITLLEYEKSRNKAESKKFTGRILVVKKELQTLDKSYNQINSDISKLISKNLNDTNNIILKTLGVNNQQPPISEIENKDTIVVAVSSEVIPGILPLKPEAIEEIKKETSQKPNKVKSKKETKKDNCQILFKGRDERTGKKLVVLTPDVILTYTPEKMNNYFRLDNYLTTNFSLEKLAGKLFINVELRFNSKDIQKSYGTINKNDFMRMDFISGKQVYFTAVAVEDPFIENYTGNTVYKAKYELMKSEDEDALKKFYLDKIGILWSSGYEAYTVYKVDFMKEKMMCLDNAN